MQKNLCRTTGKEKEKRELFVETLDDLFDIAHSDAMGLMKIEEDKFLLLQRQKGQPGSMLGVDQKQKEERALKRSEMQTARKERTYEEMEQNFDSRQFATFEKDVSGDDGESSSVC